MGGERADLVNQWQGLAFKSSSGGRKNVTEKNSYSINQFLFDSAFLLGFSGALQGIITPDFFNINNLLAVICIQLQHSLIILNMIWLIFA